MNSEENNELDKAINEFVRAMEEPTANNASGNNKTSSNQEQREMLAKPPGYDELNTIRGDDGILRVPPPSGDDSMFNATAMRFIAAAMRFVAMRIKDGVKDFGEIVRDMLMREEPGAVQAILPYLKGAYVAYCVDLPHTSLPEFTGIDEVKRVQVQCNDSGDWLVQCQPEDDLDRIWSSFKRVDEENGEMRIVTGIWAIEQFMEDDVWQFTEIYSKLFYRWGDKRVSEYLPTLKGAYCAIWSVVPDDWRKRMTSPWDVLGYQGSVI